MTEPFVFANGQQAHNAQDLIKLCQQFPEDGVNYLMREDFEKWLAYIGDTKMAQYAIKARQAAVADDQKLATFIAKSQPKAKFTRKPKVTSTQPQVATKSKTNPLAAIAKFLTNLFKGRSKTDKKPLKT